MKQNPADLEAERIFTIQRRAAGRSRCCDIALIVLCALMIFGVAVGIYLRPHDDFSAQENRTLQTFPRLSSNGKFLDRIWDGRFMRELGDFYTDQIPCRDGMVGAKAMLELALGKKENNDVLRGRNGYLIKRIEYSNAELDLLRDNLTAASTFRAAGAVRGLRVSFALAPRAIDVLEPYFPPLYTAERAESVWPIVAEYAASAGLTTLRPILADRAAAGESVWYRTDHHWTTLGAYYAYAALGEVLGYTPAAQDSFTIETASDAFLGTTYSAAGFRDVSPEPLCFYHWTGEEACVVEIFAGDQVIRTLDGFYDRSYLEKKDKYAAFLSSNNAHMRITHTDGVARPTLLLIKDSFAHSVVPFLAAHYNLEILDLRYYTRTVAAFLDTHAVDEVLILCGVDSLATSPMLTALPVGMQ